MDPLRQHQADACDFLRANQYRGLLALDPGLGKTRSAIECYAEMLCEAPVRALVIAPKKACLYTWPQELQKWAPGLRCRVAAGKPPPERIRALADRKADVVLLNVENLQWLREHCKRKKALGFGCLIVDESHRLKAGSGKRFLALRSILHGFDARILLSGTPMPYARTDLYAQSLIIDDGAALGATLKAFRESWCAYRVTHAQGGEHYVPEDRWAGMQEALAPSMFSRRLEDTNIEMPPLSVHTVYVDLPPSLLTQYKRLKRGLAHDLDLPEGLPASAAWAKMYQLASGFFYPAIEGERERAAIWQHTAKLDAVEKLSQDIGGAPCLWMAVHRAELDALRDRLPHARVIQGTTPEREIGETLDAWNRGECDILAQPVCISESLNLQAGGRHIAFFSFPTRWDVYDQVIRRLWRAGQTQPVIVHHIVSRETLDAPLLANCQRRESEHKKLHDFVREYCAVN